MKMTRGSGILFHPTSLPGPHGIGDLGDAAYRFIDFLTAAKQSMWQVLPLGPTSYGDSPYASPATFAGNPLLISLTKLVEAGDLDPSDIADVPDFPADRVDYGWVIYWKMPLLEKAAKQFLANGSSERKEAYEVYEKAEAHWLDDYALFMSIKEYYDKQASDEGVGGAMWSNYWPLDIRLKKQKAVNTWRKKQAEAIAVKKVIQFFFFEQWQAVKKYANDQGISIIGDIPIFVAADSVDVWANRHLFLLDEEGQPTSVAGVPPDYFSETGQLWGNPLYDWEAMEKDGFQWWIARIKAMLTLVDVVRVDHFRGFEAFWKVPAEEKTAMNGEWTKAPGQALFKTIKKEMGELPIIAEDLGVITKEVEALRDDFNFPGMKILQFAFDAKEAGNLNATNAFLPHNYDKTCVVYTGTHDNDTTLGWYQQSSPEEKDLVRRYMARDDHDIVWAFIRLAMASSANWAIIPLQDALFLGPEARMNTPSVLGGNWSWRYTDNMLHDGTVQMLADLVNLFGRDPEIWLAKEKQ